MMQVLKLLWYVRQKKWTTVLLLLRHGWKQRTELINAHSAVYFFVMIF